VPGLDSGESRQPSQQRVNVPGLQAPSNAPPLTWDDPDVLDFLRRNNGDTERASQALGRSIAPRIIVDRSLGPQGPAGGLF
jgi:hypothetical protein